MAYLIAQIQRLSYKTVNFIFGKTGLFIYILGWFLVITGLMMFLQPDKARRAVAQKGFGFIKGYLLIIVLLMGSMLVSFCNRLSGISSLVVLISGILFLTKAYFLLKKKTAAKINSWVSKVSAKGLKIYALIQVIVGAAMIFLQRRIW
jgi:hypothetical protein